MNTQEQTLIIGGGLTGLTLAYHLQKSGYPALVVEARDRVGGRIDTVPTTDGTPIEMGATWLGRKHTALVELLEELGLPIEEQYLSERAIYEPLSTSPPQLVQLPANNDPSYRISGGSATLIQRLVSALQSDSLLLGQPVKRVQRAGDTLHVITNEREFQVGRVVSTLPPHLLFQSVEFEPALPEALRNLAGLTHTWMGESIKFGFSFASPFWRGPRRIDRTIAGSGKWPGETGRRRRRRSTRRRPRP